MSKSSVSKKESVVLSARRKRDHVDIVLAKDVTFRVKTTGFEHVDFIHNALPELNYNEIECSTIFLNKKVTAPILISCMTGGFKRGDTINKSLAEVCEELQLPLGVGSQRQVLDHPPRVKYFNSVRQYAPSIPVLGNIGATEVARLHHAGYRIDDFHRLVESIRADALVIHCNPLQELLQPEGNTNFRGVLDGISQLVQSLRCPIIVKEVGAGISQSVAKRLIAAGVTYIDIAGAGGTSWSGIEMMRNSKRNYNPAFWDWGIPSCDSLRAVSELKREYPGLYVIASGGIDSGITAAKAIALGADMVGAARIWLKELSQNGRRSLKNLLISWIEDLKRVMFLTGSQSVVDLQRVPIVYRNQSHDVKNT